MKSTSLTRGQLVLPACSLLGLGTLALSPGTATSSPRPVRPLAHSAPRVATDYQRAVSYVRAHGRDPRESANFGRGDTLEALNSIPMGAATGRLRRVSFFGHGHLVGNDGPRESTMSTVRRVDARTVAVTYTLWRNTDQMCCPTGGKATVRYRPTNRGVRALDPIPSYDGPIHR